MMIKLKPRSAKSCTPCCWWIGLQCELSNWLFCTIQKLIYFYCNRTRNSVRKYKPPPTNSSHNNQDYKRPPLEAYFFFMVISMRRKHFHMNCKKSWNIAQQQQQQHHFIWMFLLLDTFFAIAFAAFSLSLSAFPWFHFAFAIIWTLVSILMAIEYVNMCFCILLLSCYSTNSRTPLYSLCYSIQFNSIRFQFLISINFRFIQFFFFVHSFLLSLVLLLSLFHQNLICHL